MRVIYSNAMSAAANAAQEECFLRWQADGDPSILYLYSNGPAVLIGRHQNPWAECDVAFCRARGIQVVRRLSGGGAVYHDAGNVNVSLSVPHGSWDLGRFSAALSDVLTSFGVPDVHSDGHFGLFSGGLKLCGVASAVSGGRVLMHGCLLVSADLGMLKRALQVPACRVVTGGCVQSNRSAVGRLSQFCNAGVSQVFARVENVFCHKNGIRDYTVEVASREDGIPYAARYTDDGWTYGRCGRFTLEEQRPEGRLCVTVSEGIVEKWLLNGTDVIEYRGQPLWRLL